MIYIRLFFLAVASIFVSFSNLAHGDSNVEATAHETYLQILSPFCPGRSLNDCPSSKAHDLKGEIRAELEAGKTKDQVLEEVFSKYGDQYRAVPQYSGFGKFVWLLPMAFILIGIGMATYVVNRRVRSEQVFGRGEERNQEISQEMQRKIQEELSMLD